MRGFGDPSPWIHWSEDAMRPRQRLRGNQRLVARGLSWLIGLLVVVAGVREGRGQSLWEVTPYRVHVWWIESPDARLGTRIQNRSQELQRLANSQFGAACEFTVEAAPTPWASRVLRDDLPPIREWFSEWEAARQYDRLMIVVVRPHGAATFRVATQQIDLLALVDGVAIAQDGILGADLVTSSLQQIAETFTPVARIEKIEDTLVRASLRAGALLRPESSPRRQQRPYRIDPGDVLSASIRRLDRYGRISASGVQPVDWTLLTVTERDASRLTCSVESGYRQPFQKRRSSRVEQLVTLVRRPYTTTTLRLVDRAKPEQGLPGYEVYLREGDEGTSMLLGRTNWRGELSLPADMNSKSLTLYVKSGQQLLGKLPLVPGATQTAVAALRNDDRRLEAEGFLLGVQDSLLDLVARREVIATRIREHIETGELEDAQKLLAELQRLETEDEFVRRIQQRKQSLSTVDAQVQRKIDQLFADTGALLNRFLDPGQVQQLSQRLQEARRGGSQPTAVAPEEDVE